MIVTGSLVVVCHPAVGPSRYSARRAIADWSLSPEVPRPGGYSKCGRKEPSSDPESKSSAAKCAAHIPEFQHKEECANRTFRLRLLRRYSRPGPDSIRH